jgi:hypothetical protein
MAEPCINTGYQATCAGLISGTLINLLNPLTMPAAFVEHRPKASSEYAPTSHYVIVVNGSEMVAEFKTQDAAKNAACAAGYRPVHVARQRHLQDRAQPAHWRVDPC